MMMSIKKLHRFLFWKVPSAYFCGVRVLHIDEQFSEVSVRQNWLTKNPFGSIYFAVLCMAAEVACGALMLALIQKTKPKTAMLVTKQTALFIKAKGKILFRCEDATKIVEALEMAIATGKSQRLITTCRGMDESNEIVCTMTFEWSIK